MSKFGLYIAKLFGKGLPEFRNQPEAEQFYFEYRDDKLLHLASVAEKVGVKLDYSVESLRTLEKLYFDLFEADSFSTVGTSRDDCEACMSMYYGESAHRNAGAEWVVQEFAFVQGRYELGVQKGLFTMMLGSEKDYFKTPNNKRRQSLYRDYKRHFGL